MIEHQTEAVKHSTVLDPAGQQLGRLYAQALIGAAASAGAIDEVVGQFADFVKAISEHSVLREVFASPRIKVDEKIRVLERLIGQQVNPVLLRFLKVAADRNRLGFLSEMSQAALEMRDEAMGRVVAFVRTATPMNDQLRGEVRDQISRTVAKEVVLRESVDSTLIGGVVVRVGDTVYDGSIAGRLQRMKQSVRGAVASRLAQRAKELFSGDVAG